MESGQGIVSAKRDIAKTKLWLQIAVHPGTVPGRPYQNLLLPDAAAGKGIRSKAHESAIVEPLEQ